MTHPCQWSPEVLDALEPFIEAGPNTKTADGTPGGPPGRKAASAAGTIPMKTVTKCRPFLGRPPPRKKRGPRPKWNLPGRPSPTPAGTYPPMAGKVAQDVVPRPTGLPRVAIPPPATWTHQAVKKKIHRMVGG
jgi:hypothetical protein